MEKTKYEELLNDKKCIKIGTMGGGFLKDSAISKIIQFWFSHTGPLNNFTAKPDKRISISLIPENDFLSEIPTILFSGNLLIMVNADIYEYALTFNVYNNIEGRFIKVQIQDMPQIGDSFVTQEEADGIKIGY